MSGAIPREKRTCGNCWWWVLVDDDSGLCHLLPPRVVSSDEDGGQAWACRPDTLIDDRACSKWEPK